MGRGFCLECDGRCVGCVTHFRAAHSSEQLSRWMASPSGSCFRFHVLLQSGNTANFLDSALIGFYICHADDKDFEVDGA